MNTKIERIMAALGGAMDEPEDLLQLVLGMASPSLFTELFAQGATVSTDRLDGWFDQKTRTFGGADAIDTVKTLIGNCSRFDYQDLEKIPPKDLEDLLPFFETMLSLNKRRLLKEDAGLAFKTPDDWLKDPGIRQRYENLQFRRDIRGKDAALRVVGVGHKVFEQALSQAVNFEACFTVVSGLDKDIAVFKIYDRITSKDGQVPQIVVGITSKDERLLFDWQLIDVMNDLVKKKKVEMDEKIEYSSDYLIKFIQESEKAVRERLPELHTSFSYPEVKLMSVLTSIPN